MVSSTRSKPSRRTQLILKVGYPWAKRIACKWWVFPMRWHMHLYKEGRQMVPWPFLIITQGTSLTSIFTWHYHEPKELIMLELSKQCAHLSAMRWILPWMLLEPKIDRFVKAFKTFVAWNAPRTEDRKTTHLGFRRISWQLETKINEIVKTTQLHFTQIWTKWRIEKPFKTYFLPMCLIASNTFHIPTKCHWRAHQRKWMLSPW